MLDRGVRAVGGTISRVRQARRAAQIERISIAIEIEATMNAGYVAIPAGATYLEKQMVLARLLAMQHQILKANGVGNKSIGTMMSIAYHTPTNTFYFGVSAGGAPEVLSPLVAGRISGIAGSRAVAAPGVCAEAGAFNTGLLSAETASSSEWLLFTAQRTALRDANTTGNFVVGEVINGIQRCGNCMVITSGADAISDPAVLRSLGILP